MKQVYLDINGDFYNMIFGLESDNNIDRILADIVGTNGSKGKKKAVKKTTKKTSAKKPTGNGKRIFTLKLKTKQ